MTFTTRLMGADEALACGLISEILSNGADLLERAQALAEQLAGMAPLTFQATKEAMRSIRVAISVDDSDLITRCYMSEDFKHGIEAFLTKSKPEWRGK